MFYSVYVVQLIVLAADILFSMVLSRQRADERWKNFTRLKVLFDRPNA